MVSDASDRSKPDQSASGLPPVHGIQLPLVLSCKPPIVGLLGSFGNVASGNSDPLLLMGVNVVVTLGVSTTSSDE